MPTSVRGISSSGARRAGARRAGGFTLLEVMVVVVLLGVLSTTLVFLAAPTDASLAEREARRLASLLELASSEARSSGRGLAWSADPEGYAFWQAGDDGEWMRMPDAGPFRSRRFDGHAEWREILVDARPLPPGERLVLSPYGTRSLLEAAVAGGGTRFTLRGGVLGRISLERSTDAKIADTPGAGTRLYAR